MQVFKESIARLPIPLFLLTLLLVSGCDNLGSLTVGITDAPTDDISSLKLTFTGYALTRADDDKVVESSLTVNKSIDLAKQINGTRALVLDHLSLPAGEYKQLTLKLSDTASDHTVTTKDGITSNLVLDNMDDGLTIKKTFLVEVTSRGAIFTLDYSTSDENNVDSTGNDYTVDIDLRGSLTYNSGTSEYTLSPVTRMVETSKSSQISGTVATTHLTGTDCTDSNAVYLFKGHDSDTDDIDGQIPNPLTSTLIDSNRRYTLGFIPAGDYTLAVVCNADIDQPDRNNELAFTTTLNLTVEEGRDETVDID